MLLGNWLKNFLALSSGSSCCLWSFNLRSLLTFSWNWITIFHEFFLHFFLEHLDDYHTWSLNSLMKNSKSSSNSSALPIISKSIAQNGQLNHWGLKWISKYSIPILLDSSIINWANSKGVGYGKGTSKSPEICMKY